MKRLLIVPALLLAACGGEPTAEELGDSSSELLASDWRYIPPPLVGTTYDPQDPAIATFNGTQYAVFRVDHDLYWEKREGLPWSGPQLIEEDVTSDPPSLAVFNGYLYMVYADADDRTELWLTRLDPATETWREPLLLSYEGMYGPPAIASFGGKLMFVGATESALTSTYPMWVAAMSTDETFSTAKPIGAVHEAATQPSLAVHGDKLYVAHRNGQTGSIVYSTLAAGHAATDWSPPLPVASGSFGAAAFGINPSIASVNGFLHLVHTRAGGYEESMEVWWTYFNGCTWAAEVAIPRLTTKEKDRPSLTKGGLGLVLLTADHDEDFYRMAATEYKAPPAPLTPPRCGVVGP
jgi:hypothetical protein